MPSEASPFTPIQFEDNPLYIGNLGILFQKFINSVGDEKNGTIGKFLNFLGTKIGKSSPMGDKFISIFEGATGLTKNVLSLPIYLYAYGITGGVLVKEGFTNLRKHRAETAAAKVKAATEAAAAKAKAEEEEKKKELEALNKFEADAINFENSFDLSLEEEKALELLPLQIRLLKDKETEILPVNGNPSIEAENVEFRKLFQSENIYNRFDIKLADAENPTVWTDDINGRENFNDFLKELSAGTPPTIDGSAGSLVNLYYYLNNIEETLDEEKRNAFDAAIVKFFGGAGITNIDDLRGNPTVLHIMKREFRLLIQRCTSTPPSTYKDELDKMDQLVKMMRTLVIDPNFLSKYHEYWTLGAGLEIGGNDALEVQFSTDPVRFLRWITIPTQADVTAEIARVETIRNSIDVTHAVDFDSKLTVIKGRGQAEVSATAKFIENLPPKDTENFFTISNSIVSLLAVPTFKADLENIIKFLYPGVPPTLDKSLVDRAIDPTNTSFSNEAKDLIGDIKNKFGNSDIFYRMIFDYIDPSNVSSPIDLFVDTEPYFPAIYEAHQGNLDSFISKLFSGISLSAYRANLYFTLDMTVSQLQKLKIDVSTPAGIAKLTADRNKHLENVLRGNVLLEGNLLGGRDHMQLIENLANDLVGLGVIPNIPTLTSLIPDPQDPTRPSYIGKVTNKDVLVGVPFVDMLINSADKIFKKYAASNEADRAAMLSIIEQLNILGLTAELVTIKPPDIKTSYNPIILLKYLNGVKIGRNFDLQSRIAKHPFGFVM